MRITAKENRDTHFLWMFGCVLLAILPETLLLFFAMVLLNRRFSILENHHTALLIGLSVLMALVVWIYPAYLYIPFRQAFESVRVGFETVLGSGAKSLFLILLKLIFGHSLLGHIFILHIASILVLAFEQYQKSHREIESFGNVMQDTTQKKKVPKTQKVRGNENMPGYTLLGFADRYNRHPVYIANNARHVFVCGTTGSGKTVALANAIESAVWQNYPLVLIDGKGDTGDGSILDIVTRLRGNKKLYVINLSDILSSCSYNPFKGATSTIAKDMLVSLTDWSEEHYKANTERYIQRLIHLMELNTITLSFDNLLRYFPTQALKELSAESYKAEIITKDEHLHTLQIIESSGTIAINAAARFITMQESEIGHLLNSGGVDVYQAIEENAIILFVLNPLIYPELTKLFGRLILTDCKKAVSKLYTYRKERVFFVFDEINTYASSVLIDLLNKSRSANVTCFCATQSLADLEESSSEAFREQVIENCNNYIVLRQNSAKYSEIWAKTLGTVDSLSVTYQLGNGQTMSGMDATGRGSATKERKFIYHPDVIKFLQTGEAIYMSKDTGEHHKIYVRKGF